MKRWAVLISGRGSNLASLIDARNAGEDFDLRLVMSSSPTALGLLRAKRAGVPTEITPVATTSTGKKKIDWRAVERLLSQRGITHIFLAGFMKIVPAEFLAKWDGRVVNLHPSLLPLYPGLDSIARCHADGAALGVTVHEVIEDVDAGTMICQRRCLKPTEVQRYSLAAAELLIHIDEQRAVKEAIRRWKNQTT